MRGKNFRMKQNNIVSSICLTEPCSVNSTIANEAGLRSR